MGITLRPWRREDALWLAQCANNPRVAAWLREGFPSPYTAEEAARFIEYCLAHPDEREQRYAIDLDGRAIGSISYQLCRDTRVLTAEIGYWLGADYWGKGYGIQAVKEICLLIFSTSSAEEITAEVFAENLPSRRLLEKCGFTLERSLEKSALKNGIYRDICEYRLPRPGSEVNQREPAGSSLQKDADFQALSNTGEAGGDIFRYRLLESKPKE